MKCRRRFLPLVAGALAAAALVLSAGLASRAEADTSVAGTATGSATFADPAGDSNGAPDITAIALSDDAATGTITISITVTGLQPRSDIEVYLNTDKLEETGSPSGSEFVLAAGEDPGGWWWDVDRWESSRGTWQSVPESPAMSWSQSGDVMTWTVSKADLGGTTGFKFWTGAFLTDADGNTVAADYAPDSGRLVYDLSAPAGGGQGPHSVLKPVIGEPTTTPAKAVAGKHLLVTFPVTRSDNGTPLLSGTVSAVASVAGKKIAGAGQMLRNGEALVSFVVPIGAKGKLLKLSVTVKAAGQAATRVSTFRVS